MQADVLSLSPTAGAGFWWECDVSAYSLLQTATQKHTFSLHAHLKILGNIYFFNYVFGISKVKTYICDFFNMKTIYLQCRKTTLDTVDWKIFF